MREGHGWPDRKGFNRHATISDNVTIYALATILGGKVVIGEGAVVGGNVWLTESVPAGTTVTISKPELVYKKASGREARRRSERR